MAALALVGLGLANLYLTGATELAVRQAMIAGGGVLALALFWQVRVRLLGVLGWAAYGAAVLLLVAVLAVGLVREWSHPVVGIGQVSFQPSELAKLGLLLVLAAVLGSSRPAWQRFSLAVLLFLSYRSRSPWRSRTSAPQPCSRSSPGPCSSSGGCLCGSCCR